jgi:putative permease
LRNSPGPLQTPDRMQPNTWRRIIVSAAAAAVIAGFVLYVAIKAFAPDVLDFLAALRGVFPPFIIAIALALLLDPFVKSLESRRIGRTWAALIIFLAFAVLVAASAAILVPVAINQVNQFASDVPSYYNSSVEFFSDLAVRARPLLQRLRLPTTASGISARFSEQIQTGFRAIGSYLVVGVGSAVGKSLWLVLIVLMTFMLLKDLDRIRGKILYLLPEVHRDRLSATASAVGTVFVRYLRGLIIVCILYGITAAVLFSILKIRYSLLIGVAAGFLYAIPYIGAVLTTLIVFTISLLQHPDAVYLAFVFTGLSLGLNQVFDMIITPRVVGGAVGLHPVISIFALMFGGAAFGVVGMLLAVPIAGSLQIVLCQVFPKLSAPLERFAAEPEQEEATAEETPPVE